MAGRIESRRSLAALLAIAALMSLPAIASRKVHDESRSSKTGDQYDPDSLGLVTECKPDQKKSDCVGEMYSILEPRFLDYESCDNSTRQKLKQVEDLEQTMLLADKEGSANVPSLKAQIRNMVAQNTKLVAELGKYQGFSSENEKMQRTIRKTSTELDLLKNQVEVLSRKVKDEKRRHAEMEKEERVKTERCEEEIGLLKDVFWSNSIKVPDAAR